MRQAGVCDNSRQVVCSTLAGHENINTRWILLTQHTGAGFVVSVPASEMSSSGVAVFCSWYRTFAALKAAQASRGDM